ncbi:hypothetical protein Gohar_000340 [Gossypium harknessii]|uniref:RNase H type-1 domain-containing protein n=1 Tax=Gossypium harknessii TaxID=34285 RepID=A0A7J9I0C7_9ROSI|nr:hypothetical protein [Gossypium harknessii]
MTNEGHCPRCGVILESGLHAVRDCSFSRMSYAKSDSAWPQPNPLVSDTWWSPLEKGWIKHNTDEAMPYISNWASMGGVIRDADARWLCWFSMAVSKETIFRIEARAILEGLPIAWEKGFRQVELECDNAFLVETLLAGGPASSRLVELRLFN